MTRRISFWCGVSAVLTLVCAAIVVYAVVLQGPVAVSAPAALIAAVLLGRQTLGLFSIRRTATAEEADDWVSTITRGGAWVFVILACGAAPLPFIFGREAIPLVVGYAVLMAVELTVALLSARTVARTHRSGATS